LTSEEFPYVDENIAEVAFAGRSNVGKSSLLRALSLRKVDIESQDRPGTTRHIGFYQLPHKYLRLVDLPGYGFAYGTNDDIITWNTAMTDYLQSRKTLKRVFVLIDARHGLKHNDLEFITNLEKNHRKFQIILTKTDLVSPPDLARRIYIIEQQLVPFKRAQHPIGLVSTITTAGIHEVWKFLANYVPTTEIDKMQRVVDTELLVAQKSDNNSTTDATDATDATDGHDGHVDEDVDATQFLDDGDGEIDPQRASLYNSLDYAMARPTRAMSVKRKARMKKKQNQQHHYRVKKLTKRASKQPNVF
jgi:GTP-binding protein